MGTELVSFEQFDDHVEATIRKSTGGTESVETKSYGWLIGADGGRSTAPPSIRPMRSEPYAMILQAWFANSWDSSSKGPLCPRDG